MTESKTTGPKVKEATLGEVREFLEQTKGRDDKQPRIHSENLQPFLCDPDFMIRQEEIFYPVPVDHRLSFKEMVEGCACDFVRQEFNEKNFPLKGKGLTATNFGLIDLAKLNKMLRENGWFSHRSTNTLDMWLLAEYLEEIRRRHTTIDELMAFSKHLPELQKKSSISSLGSQCSDPDCSGISPRLGWDKRVGRYLGIFNRDIKLMLEVEPNFNILVALEDNTRLERMPR